MLYGILCMQQQIAHGNYLLSKMDYIVEQANKINGQAKSTDTSTTTSKKSNEEIAEEVIAGKWGNGDTRKTTLENAGYNYSDIQSIVNQKLTGNSSSTSSLKSIETIAQEVIAGQWGNGEDRKNKLTSAGYNYSEVQAKVNSLLGSSNSTSSNKKSNEEIANEVIKGLWGNGTDRKNKITSAGYDYNAIQKIVNQKLK